MRSNFPPRAPIQATVGGAVEQSQFYQQAQTRKIVRKALREKTNLTLGDVVVTKSTSPP